MAINKKQLVIGLGVILVIAIIGGFIFLIKQDNTFHYSYVTVEKHSLSSEVTASGLVKPAERVDMAFERSGKIIFVGAQSGDKITAGEKLISLDVADLGSQIKQADGRIAEAQAQLDQLNALKRAQEQKLTELKNGARPEDVAVKQAELATAKQALKNAYSSAVNSINDAYAKADEVLNKNLDGIFTGEELNNPQLVFVTSNGQAKIDAESGRYLWINKLSSWRGLVDKADSTNYSEVDSLVMTTESKLNDLRGLLNNVTDCLSGTSGLDANMLAVNKTNVSVSRTNINLAYTSVNTQEQTISAQKLVVDRIVKELDLKLAGTLEQQVSAQAEQVKQAQDNINAQSARIAQMMAGKESLLIQLNKSILVAPFNGMVAERKANNGEFIAAGASAISVISGNNFEIEIGLPENEIGKVKLEDPAEVTLDAYGADKKFVAKVILIDPVASIINGRNGYRVKLQFNEVNDLIKGDMNANVKIYLAPKTEALALPKSAVIEQKGQYFVAKSAGQLQPIMVGSLSGDNFYEVISGLTEGEKVLDFSQK
ncbi:MAG: HlyD family efflux transporter periplasmic adaptor subunit [bacterium]